SWRRWTFARRSQGVSLETLPMEEAVASTRLAVGISSIMLAELRMWGVAVASLQPATANRAYYCLPFEDLGITRLADERAPAQCPASPVCRLPIQTPRIHMTAIETATRLLLELVADPSPVLNR